ncbi:stromelysin-1-like [Amphiura filiformis]|uniref:stromelysin-1-like n=1 Tax=Amphiura filiformis TaxID=82378 RepID=UPI003B21595F
MQGVNIFGLLVSLSFCTFFAQARPVENADDARMYLQRFNHMGRGNMDTGRLPTEADFIEAISSFQRMANITVTGKLDSETMEMMNLPRCGMPDNMGFSHKARRRRYSAMTMWNKNDLTWRINSNTPDLNNALTKDIMQGALEIWSDVSGLTFEETTDAGADIIIDFFTGEHGDGNPFDGPGSVLAHAYFPIPQITGPSIAGDAHFDDQETFTDQTSAGINLFQVAAHEFGHSLGLGHSDDQNALMYAFYRGYIPNFELPQDDINGIQYLYGTNTDDDQGPDMPDVPAPGAPDPTMMPFNPPTCPSKVDAFTSTGDGRTFAFIGDMVYERVNDGIADGFPQQISQVFAGLPNNVDAALYYPGNRKTYFFKGDQYWRFSSTTADAGYPRPISDWGLPADIDSAFIWSGNGRIYFTKGDQYYRYPVRNNPDYPRPLSVWGLPVQQVDAVFQYSNRRTYFFAGDVYYRFNDATFGADDGYPRPTAYWWFGCGDSNLEQMTTDKNSGNMSASLPSTLAFLLSVALALLHLV